MNREKFAWITSVVLVALLAFQLPSTLAHRDDDYAFVKTSPPSSLWGQRLADTGIRSQLGVTVVGVKRVGAEFTYATADTVLERGDLVVVAGETKKVEAFAEQE